MKQLLMTCALTFPMLAQFPTPANVTNLTDKKMTATILEVIHQDCPETTCGDYIGGTEKLFLLAPNSRTDENGNVFFLRSASGKSQIWTLAPSGVSSKFAEFGSDSCTQSGTTVTYDSVGWSSINTGQLLNQGPWTPDKPNYEYLPVFLSYNAAANSLYILTLHIITTYTVDPSSTNFCQNGGNLISLSYKKTYAIVRVAK